MTDEERREALEHRDALLDIRAILSTSHGRRFFKYLFKVLDVAELPDIGVEGPLLHERLGFLRVGHSIFKLASEANHEVSGQILAEIEKEKYERLIAEYTNNRTETGDRL